MSLIGKIVGYWGLDGGSTDSHGSNDGTDNSITYNTPGVLATNYASFAGPPSRIDLGSVPVTGTGSWSIFFWLRFSGGGSFEDCLGFGRENPNEAVFMFINPSGSICCDLYSSAGAASTTAINDGQWHLVGAVYDSVAGTVQMYVDGSADGSSASISPNLGSIYAWFGQAWSGGTNLTGDMSDISIYNDTLTSGEIGSLWNGGSGNLYPFGFADLVANQASFSLSGISTGTLFGHRLTAAAASFLLTGNAATLVEAYPPLVADQITFDLNQPPTMVNFTLGTTNLLIANRATFVLVGNDATITRTLSVSAGSLSLSGQAANFTRAYNLVAASGSFALAGQTTGILYGRVVINSTGTFAFSGVAINFAHGFLDLVADQATYDLNQPPTFANFTLGTTNLLIANRAAFVFTSNDATPYKGYPLSANQATFTLSGVSVNTIKANIISSAVGSFTLSGQATNLYKDLRFTSDVTSLSLSGVANAMSFGRYVEGERVELILASYDAGLIKTNQLPADVAPFSFTGNSAGVLRGYYISSGDAVAFSILGISTNFYKDLRLTNDVGSLSLSGIDASFYFGYGLSTSVGNIVFTGSDLSFSNTEHMPVDVGSFSFSGQIINLAVGKSLPVDVGSFNLSGINIEYLRTYINEAGSGWFTQFPQTAGILRGFKTTPDTGNYVFSGVSSNYFRGYNITSGLGAFAFSGNLNGLFKTNLLSGELGQYIGNYKSLDLYRTRIVSLDAGSYALSAFSSTFIRGLIMGLDSVGFTTNLIIEPSLTSRRLPIDTNGGFILSTANVDYRRTYAASLSNGEFYLLDLRLSNGTAAYWKLDGNSIDSLGNNNGTDANIIYSSGNIGQGAGFNGASSTITVGTLSSFSFMQNTGRFTMAFWVKVNNAGVLEYLMGNTPTSSEKGFFLGHNANGSMTFVLVNGDGNPSSLISHTVSSFFTDTNWHHIAIVADKATNLVQFYKDAVVLGSSTVGTLSIGNSTRTLMFGRINGFASNFFNGMLDEIGFWNRPLSSQEISRLYLSGLAYPFSIDSLLIKTNRLSPDLGIFSLSSHASGLLRGASLGASQGIFSEVGQAVQFLLLNNKIIFPVSLGLTMDGKDIQYIKISRLDALTKELILSGYNNDFRVAVMHGVLREWDGARWARLKPRVVFGNTPVKYWDGASWRSLK